MLTVHHLRQSQSERIVWLCEELGLDYALKLYDRRSDNRLAPDDYKALHPMGIAPVIEDDGLTLGESGAIVDYIAATYGKGHLVPPPGDADYADHLFWLHFSNGTFMATLMMQMMLGMAGAEGTMPAAFAGERARLSWDLIEQRLGDAEYFGGRSLTTADIMMGYALTTARAMRGIPLRDDQPNLKAYLQRIGAREAYRRAMEKAEPGFTPVLD